MSKLKISTDDCWLWAGYLSEKGYGTLYSNGKLYRAHRVIYELEVGRILESLEIDHLCKVTQCVNPFHLEPVTHMENMQRKFGKNLCKRGHLLTPDNVYVAIKHKKTGRVGRMCRTCGIANVKSNQKRKKLELAKAK